MTTPRQQLIKAVEKRLEADCQHAGSCFTDHYADALSGVQALSDLGAVVLMPVQVAEIPKGSTVHLPPPTVSLNWPEGAYRPFVNGDSKVYVDALKGTR